jgi:hypothetical protein
VSSPLPVHDAAPADVPTSSPASGAEQSRLRRRLIPLLAVAGLIMFGVASSIWWGPELSGRAGWSVPNDLWGTMIAASRLLHGNLAGLYTHPTGLITLPGGAIILVPVVAVIDAFGVSLHLQSAHNPDPPAWLLAGPYQTAISGVALFAADAIAEHLGLTRGKRILVAGASAIALWNVSLRWGHPEDAVAVGLFLYAVLALSSGKIIRCSWLVGAAVAIQPLVLLALPVLLIMLPVRRIPAFLTRAAIPGTVLLAIAAAANWPATYAAVFTEPNWPHVDKPTPWLALATPLGQGAVAAGPVRLIAIAAACACAIAAARQCRGALPSDPEAMRPQALLRLLWWIAVALALRSVFEPVMVAFYLWPVLAIALITATARWSRLITTCLLVAGLTAGAQVPWQSWLAWWAPVVLVLALILLVAWPVAEGAPSWRWRHRHQVRAAL